MTTLFPSPITRPSLCTAIAEEQHSQSLKLLQQLPLRNRWETFFLLNRTFAKNTPKDYIRALTHDLLYRAYREECGGNLDEASRLYRLLIQHSADRRITQKAREGYQRIRTGKTESKKPSATKIVQPVNIPSDQTSLVLLTTVSPSEKQALAVKLADLLNTDPYTARMTLPSIEFRMLRYGMSNNMEGLHQSLTQAGMSSQHISLKTIQSLPVFEVLYIESVDENLVVQVRDSSHANQSTRMVFPWTDIQQSVEALLPLFEEVIDTNTKREIIRKTSTQDHAQILDLHLQDRQGILRFYDAGYQFNQGLSLVTTDNPRALLDTKTSWAQWQGLKQLLSQHLPSIPEHHKFDNFATHAVEQIELLTKIEAHIHLLRRYECYWDHAFHLYSALHYLVSI